MMIKDCLLTAEQLNELVLKRMRQDDPDLCDQLLIAEDGKKGLKDCNGNLIVPALFDDIPEIYSQHRRGNLIPVVKNGEFHLYDILHQSLMPQKYDRVFRYFSEEGCFVVINNGKKGLINGQLETIIPIEMDEIYEKQDTEGCIVFTKGDKWGAYHFGQYAPPVFERMEVESEEYVKVWLNGVQGWIDCNGNFTKDESLAYFGSWYDTDK